MSLLAFRPAGLPRASINNGSALRSGDYAARALSLEALNHLSRAYAAWRGAKLPVAVAAE
jgi:hypothetical protein